MKQKKGKSKPKKISKEGLATIYAEWENTDKIANQDGTNATTNILFLRTFLKNISSVLSLIAIILAIPLVKTIGSFFGFIIFIGCFFALGSNKQAIHDMIAKTAVFKIADLKE